MVFKTKLNEDILNIIFEFTDINPKYEYYKRVKQSSIGYKKINMEYNCCLCKKKIRNIKLHGIYGFILYFYNYYDVEMTSHYYDKNGISRFYQPKKTNSDRELYEILRNVQGDITETPYCFSISMRNIIDKQILGKLIINTMSNLLSNVNKFNHSKRKLERCGIVIDVKMDSKEKILNKIKTSILNLNDGVTIGYYCKNCCNNKKYYNFIKL